MAAEREPVIIDPFHRMLRDEMRVAVGDRVEALADGSAGSFDDYRYQCGYLQAIKDVLDKCLEIERRTHGEMMGEG
jgi:hypothetical protein